MDIILLLMRIIYLLRKLISKAISEKLIQILIKMEDYWQKGYYWNTITETKCKHLI